MTPLNDVTVRVYDLYAALALKMARDFVEGGGREGREGDPDVRQAISYLFKPPGGSDLVVELIQVHN